uniref:Uncharacterized protein n=1 Tax=Anguilla anguilla TaxID=7936 RepID=A0A0E9W2N3_ANGAN
MWHQSYPDITNYSFL